MEHNPTLMKEMTNDFSTSTFVNSVFTIMETSNSQTTGDTGLNICTIQLKDVLKVVLNPNRIPVGTAIIIESKKPAKTVFKLVFYI